MSTIVKDYVFQARFPMEDKAELVRAAEATGQSINQLVVASVRKALPSVVSAMLSPTGRVTNVDPLPEAVLRRLYSEREDDDASIRRMVATQPLGAE